MKISFHLDDHRWTTWTKVGSTSEKSWNEDGDFNYKGFEFFRYFMRNKA